MVKSKVAVLPLALWILCISNMSLAADSDQNSGTLNFSSKFVSSLCTVSLSSEDENGTHTKNDDGSLDVFLGNWNVKYFEDKQVTAPASFIVSFTQCNSLLSKAQIKFSAAAPSFNPDLVALNGDVNNDVLGVGIFVEGAANDYLNGHTVGVELDDGSGSKDFQIQYVVSSTSAKLSQDVASGSVTMNISYD